MKKYNAHKFNGKLASLNEKVYNEIIALLVDNHLSALNVDKVDAPCYAYMDGVDSDGNDIVITDMVTKIYMNKYNILYISTEHNDKLHNENKLDNIWMDIYHFHHYTTLLCDLYRVIVETLKH